LQPDTIVPNPYNPQSLNRYSYALNNPIRYNDPSGHCAGPGNVWIPNGTSYCTTSTRTSIINAIMGGLGPEKILEIAGVELYNISSWSSTNVYDAASAVLNSGYSLLGAGAGTSWDSAFKETYGDMRFVLGNAYEGTTFSGDCASFSGGCSPGYIGGKLKIAFNVTNYKGVSFSTLVTHELGHIFFYWYGWATGEDHWGASYATSGLGSNWYDNRNNVPQCNNSDFGHEACLGNSVDWQHASGTGGSKIFADLFTAWAFNGWSSEPNYLSQILQASSAMNSDMSTWISRGKR
jgi:hypothetical protein